MCSISKTQISIYSKTRREEEIIKELDITKTGHFSKTGQGGCAATDSISEGAAGIYVAF